eukprot:403336486
MDGQFNQEMTDQNNQETNNKHSFYDSFITPTLFKPNIQNQQSDISNQNSTLQLLTQQPSLTPASPSSNAIQTQQNSKESSNSGEIVNNNKDNQNAKRSLQLGEEFQVYNFDQGILYRKDKLSDFNAIIMLLSAALGSGSMQEFIYIFGGGRGGILFVTLLQIMLYSIMPIFFICIIPQQLNSFIDNFDVTVQDQLRQQKQNINELYNDLMILTVALILSPSIFIRDFNRIKNMGIMIGIGNIILLLSIGIFSLIQGSYMHTWIGSEVIEYGSAWLFMPKIAFAFEFQAYFMIVYQCLEQKQQTQHGLRVAMWTSGINVTYCIAFCLFSFGAKFIYLSSTGTVQLGYTIKYLSWIVNWILVTINFLQIPFKFYLGKEFVFILIDELLNKSLSGKMEDLKQFQIGKQVYSDHMINKVREDVYNVIRMPYMKFSNKFYYSISAAVYLVNFILVLLIRGYYEPMFQAYNPLQYFVRVAAAVVQPLMTYILPGLFYHLACRNYDINTKMRHIALPFVGIGFFVMLLNVTFVFYEMVLIFYYKEQIVTRSHLDLQRQLYE